MTPTGTTRKTPLNVFQIFQGLRAAGHNVYVFGLTPDRERALVVDVDNDSVRTTPIFPENTDLETWKWECSKSHLFGPAVSRYYRMCFPPPSVTEYVYLLRPDLEGGTR